MQAEDTGKGRERYTDADTMGLQFGGPPMIFLANECRHEPYRMEMRSVQQMKERMFTL